MNSFSAVFLGFFAMASLSLPLLYWFWKRHKNASSDLDRLSQQVIQLQEVLVGIPDGLYRWNIVNGVENCSARMAVLLDLPKGTQSRFGDILTCFDDDVAQTLNNHVTALHSEGLSFDLVLPLPDGDERVIQAVGQRVLNDDGTPLVDLLWMRHANAAVIATGPVARSLQNITQERDRLITALKHTPVPLWIRNAAGHITFKNDLAPQEDFSHQMAQHAKETGRTVRERFSFTDDQESPQTFEVSEIPLPNGEGFIGTADDITLIETTKKSAQKGESLLRAALENLVTAIAVFGGDTRLDYYNTAYAQLWDFDPAWLDTHPSYGEILDRLRETRKLPEYANFRNFRQEQVAKFVELQGPEETSLHLPNNAIIRAVTSPHPISGLVMSFEDVSQTVALESSNKALSAIQRQTLDNLFEGVVVFGPNGKVRLFNPAFAQIWHLDPAFLETQPHISDVLEKCKSFYEGVENWEAFREQLSARFMMRESDSQRLVRSDGSILEYASVPLPDGGSLLSYLDVTDSAVVEQALRERSDAQHEADRLKSEFIANVSYEIRTPLTTLIGFAELLCEQYFGEMNKRQMEYAKAIHGIALELNDLVADILELATIEAGQVELEPSSIDVQTMLLSVLRLVRESAKHAQLHIDFNCPQDIGLYVGDEKRLKQVVFNLLTNAIHHTPANGTITLSAKRDPYHLILSIGDTGVGIAPEDQARIFGSFERTNAALDGSKGAGLGLTLVKSFIELHNGTVSLDSIANKGTLITCRLPLTGNDT